MSHRRPLSRLALASTLVALAIGAFLVARAALEPAAQRNAPPASALGGERHDLARDHDDPGPDLEASERETPRRDEVPGARSATRPQRESTAEAASRVAEEPDSPAAEVSGAAPAAEIAGSITGFLVREGGAWTEATLPKPRTVMLDLVSTRDRRLNLRGEISAEPDGAGGLRLGFAFEDVPAGEYELTLSALGSYRWAPASVRLRPPLAGVTFTRFDRDEKLPLAFEVLDAADGARVEAFQTRHLQLTPSRDTGVFLHTGPLELDQFPKGSRFAWSLWAEGYQPAFGDDTAFVEQDGKRVASVRLARGWATKVLVLARDPEARQVRGAEVLVDGRSAGFTDGDGLLVVGSAARPTRLEVRFGDWKPISDPLEPYNGLRAEQRGQVTIVMLAR